MSLKCKFIKEWLPERNGRCYLYNGPWMYDWGNKPPTVGTEIRVLNAFGGFHYHIVNEHDVFVEEEPQKVWREYYMGKSDEKCGWIDREGNFYGCGRMDHAICIGDCFDLYESEAEQAGFIKLYYDDVLAEHYPERFLPSGLGWYLDHNKKMTNEQKATLINRGFSVIDEEEY